ncbi:putative ribonuclease H-like domain-containing protein [Tanacetum coccineum]
MTGDQSLLRNFIEKFMGTVRFKNDNFTAITGYGDYIHNNITICHVYYVEGLGHNLFSVGQFCDGDLEVGFRSNTCYVRNWEGDDLLTGGRDSNLYTISISDMVALSPVCFMSKATSTKSWLWHRRRSHLNFGTINDLTRLDLVNGLPKFKYGKDHLCSACERGKSKKASHPPKLVPSDYSKFKLLHMDLCGPMRVASINGKKSLLEVTHFYFAAQPTQVHEDSPSTSSIIVDEQASPISLTEADEFDQEDTAYFDGWNADLQGTPTDQTTYRRMIGGLMYLIASRPDIAFATFVCACYQVRPTVKHLKEMQNMQDVKMIIKAHQEDLIWMRTQLLDYGYKYNRIPMYYDSKSSIAISCNLVQHSKTKHIDIRYHFIKEHVEKGTMEIYFVGIEYQLADQFTKALPKERFEYLVHRIVCAKERFCLKQAVEIASAHRNSGAFEKNCPVEKIFVKALNIVYVTYREVNEALAIPEQAATGKETSNPFMADYPIWEVIQRGNGHVSVSTDTNGQIKVLPPKTAEEILARERERKARTTLLMAIPEDHLENFHKITDVKEMRETIKSRFGGNDESKKMFQSLLSQLEIHGAGVSTEDANQKFLRSLPTSWSQVSLIMRTKPGVDNLSFDDLYNNLKVFETHVKGSTRSSSSAQNVAFVSSKSILMIGNRFEMAGGEIEEVLQKDREKICLVWMPRNMVAFLIKTKVECFNCHNIRHFARECKSKGNQEGRRRDTGNTGYKAKVNRRRPGKQEEPKALVTLDGDGVDWTGSNTEVTSCSKECEESYAKLKKFYDEQREQLGDASIEIQAYTQALKRFMKIDLDDKTNVLIYHKKLLAEAVKEKEELKTKLENFQSSSKGLSKLLNSQTSAKDKSGIGYRDQIHEGVLSYENEVLESVFDSRSSDVEDSPMYDRFAKVEGMHAVLPPMTGIYMPPKSDFRIDESNFTYGPKQTKTSESAANTNDSVSYESNSSVETLESVPKPVVNKPKAVSKPKFWSDAPIIKEYESDSDDEYMIKPSKEQEKSTFAFVNTVKHVKTPRETVKEQNTYSPINDARQNLSSQASATNTARKINTARPIINEIRPRSNFYKSYLPIRRPSNRTIAPKANFENHKVNTARDKIVSAVGGNRETAVKASDNPQKALMNKRIIDSGCSKHMTGNKSYLVEYQDYNGGPVTFGGSKGQITGKGKIITRKLDFEDVYFVKELKQFNLFSVSQMCDKKNKVLFTDSECLVLSPDFKLPDENQVLLRVPRQNNMYSFNLENIVPTGGLACLIAKATIDESNKWHRRLGHVNFKILNKLVKGNLVRGLPSKIFQNDHTCVACQKGKQHKASCKAKVVSSISQPLQLLHMDLFGPTSVRSINHKTYCLVITDDFSRTPQQNGVAKRKNRTLIEAARTMLVDSFLPNTFWAEAVSTACYVLNRVLVTKPHNKTPYELITGKIPIISYIRPFGCHVTILNTIDHLGKFKEKSDEGLLVGYSLNSKAFRVYNLETKRVEENLHINFLENKPNVVGKGPNWLFDLDYLTDSMNYQPVTAENKANKTAGPKEANHSAGTQDNIDAGNSEMEVEPTQEYFILPLWSSYTSTVKSSEAKNGDEKRNVDSGLKTNEETKDQEDQAFLKELERLKRQEKEANDPAKAFRKEFAQCTNNFLLQAGAARTTSTNVVNYVTTPISTANPSRVFSAGGPDLTNNDQDDSQIPALEEIYDNLSDGIFTNASYDK